MIGRYTRLDGKTGVVMEQDGTNIVHVYGTKWLKPAGPSAESAEAKVERLTEALKPFSAMVTSYEKASIAFLRETQSSAANDMSDEAIMQVHTPDEVAAATDGAMRKPCRGYLGRLPPRPRPLSVTRHDPKA